MLALKQLMWQKQCSNTFAPMSESLATATEPVLRSARQATGERESSTAVLAGQVDSYSVIVSAVPADTFRQQTAIVEYESASSDDERSVVSKVTLNTKRVIRLEQRGREYYAML